MEKYQKSMTYIEEIVKKAYDLFNQFNIRNNKMDSKCRSMSKQIISLLKIYNNYSLQQQKRRKDARKPN